MSKVASGVRRDVAVDDGPPLEARLPTPPRDDDRARGLKSVLIPLAIAAVLWLLGVRQLAVIVVVVTTIVTIASAVSPRFRRGFHRVLVFVADTVGRALAFLLLGAMWLLVFAPVGLIMKVFRVDPLRASVGTDENTTWHAHVDQVPSSYTHQFSAERTRDRELATTRWGRTRHRVAVAILAVLCIAVIDLASGMTLNAVRPVNASPERHLEATAAHADDPWAAEYYEAVDSREYRYDASRAFIPSDVSSKYLNVVDGIRRSYAARGVGDDPVKVFFFGGSVLWGLGQRDAHTIPSDIARIAEREGIDVEVVNYGQSSYSLWQEVRLFEEVLAAGDIPDLAVFLDGANDAFAHFENPSGDRETTTLEGDLRELVARGEAQRDGEDPGGAIANGVELYGNNSLSGRLWRSLFGSPNYRAPLQPSPPASQHASQIAALYHRSVDTAKRLASSYGIETLFFWQPIVSDKEPLNPGEPFGEVGKFPGFIELWDHLSPLATTDAIDLRNVYAGVSDPVFTDAVHTNEAGAAIVAEAMMQAIRPVLQAHTAPTGSGDG